MYHRKITTAIVFIFLFTAIEVVFAMGAWRVFGKNLWDKLHEAFSTDEISTTAEEEEQQQEVVSEEQPQDNTHVTTDEEEDGYMTED